MLDRDVGITLKQSTFKGMYQERMELAKPARENVTSHYLDGKIHTWWLYYKYVEYSFHAFKDFMMKNEVRLKMLESFI